eukprot:3748710-Rhodomonas_salina.1
MSPSPVGSVSCHTDGGLISEHHGTHSTPRPVASPRCELLLPPFDASLCSLDTQHALCVQHTSHPFAAYLLTPCSLCTHSSADTFQSFSEHTRATLFRKMAIQTQQLSDPDPNHAHRQEQQHNHGPGSRV